MAAGLVARMHLGLRLMLAALPGFAQAARNCGRVAGVQVVSARAAVTIARRHLPGLVAELEAHVQLALDRRILTLWDCLGCRHFHLLCQEVKEIPFQGNADQSTMPWDLRTSL